ncbi:MAG: hypothetical protein LQ350_005342 [Teloschistes chrysophthalmus]|nr:MAG: hypothetical protein LQ350_005342 [Niorma chrysophthalma]
MVATESAREARKSFYCELCNKGYGRINELEAHEGSYDHLHKKRLKDLRQMSRDPTAADRARRHEAADSPFSIKPISLNPTASTTSSGNNKDPSGKVKGGGFKKGGFKNAFAPADDGGDEEGSGKGEGKENLVVKEEGKGEGVELGLGLGMEVEDEDEDDGLDEGERYDPHRPTGCWDGCEGRG